MRSFWIGFGLAVHILFAFTVCCLFPFLQGPGVDTPLSPPTASWWWIDALIALHFGIPHSLLLWRGTRDRLEAFIPRPLYGCFFTLVTCASLLLTIFLWQPSGVAVWRIDGVAGYAISGTYLLGWVALLYSISLTGAGYQTGWTPFWHWLRNDRVPPRKFEPTGAYRLLRHPVYLSLLVLVWATPVLTADRVILNATWTIYIFVGSWFKDRRLEYYIGEPYRQYQAEVAGYPFIWGGPLGRARSRSAERAEQCV